MNTEQIPAEKLIDRIRKMHAKAESARQLGLEAEALAFATAVQKLLLKHNLEMSEVEAAAADKEDPVKAHYYRPEIFGFKPRKQRILWTEALARVVAEAHMCGVLPVHRSNEILLIGTRQNRQAAEFMLVFLTRYAVEHSQKDYVAFFYKCRAEGDVTMAQGYKDGWLRGFVGRVAERYRAELKAVVKEAEVKNPYAMVRLTGMLAKVKDVRDSLADHKGTPPQGRQQKDGTIAGAADGVGHGSKVQLRGMGLEQRPEARTVGPGQRLLRGG